VQGCYDFEDDIIEDGTYACNKGEWYDLDSDEKLCKSCKFEWTNTCCGDDHKENFIRGKDGTGACCKNPSDLVISGQCVTTIDCGNNKLDSGEQCEESDTINNKFCSQNMEKCFGTKVGRRDSLGMCDSECYCEKDKFQIGCVKDVCGASCGNDDDCNEGERCNKETCGCEGKTYCGDGLLQEQNEDNWKEECEYPNTALNPFCNETLQCFGLKTGIRDSFGDCDENCQCTYGPYQQVCIKNSCNSECNQDGSGCGPEEICDLTSCGCVKSKNICGDNKCEIGEEFTCLKDCVKKECPWRIDIDIEEGEYFQNDTMNLQVKIYDKEKNLIPNVNFNLDLVFANKQVKTTLHSTSEDGTFKKRTLVSEPEGDGTYEYARYIAKTNYPGCNIVSDTESLIFYIKRPPPPKIALSSFIIKPDTVKVLNVTCGDGEIGAGEACEGNSICRTTLECDYQNRVYDFPEICNNCNCPLDVQSSQDDQIYCSNCDKHCGDGSLNCGEECEEGIRESREACIGDKLYKKIDSCKNCVFEEDGSDNDILINDCNCECSKITNNCENGNWIERKEFYNAGCSDGKCGTCNCEDTYTKDTDNDGIEDKCDIEICNNKIDDNDDGKVDMNDPQCSICKNCGLGKFNICDENECGTFQEGCFFNVDFFNYGNCLKCEGSVCGNYGKNEELCKKDSCSLNNCIWNGNSCCTDSDKDNSCDTIDNCPNIYNPDQLDTDNDLTGNACETCINEPFLKEPSEKKETNCDDGIDNDCDGVIDCNDIDCAGIGNCCFNDTHCGNNSCIIESCVKNECNYKQRSLCDNTECNMEEYCEFGEECVSAENSEIACLNCATDKTINDSGIGFGNFFNKTRCCGNDINEYYFNLENKSSCCQTYDCK